MRSYIGLAVLILCACACQTLAGELSDSLNIGNSSAEAAHSVQGGSSETISALVGAVSESTDCRASSSTLNSSFQLKLHKQPGQIFTLQIQEVYPPESPGVRYGYNVEVDGTLVYVRDYIGLMCGTVSYFIKVDNAALLSADEITLKFTNIRSDYPFRISAIWLFSDFAAYCQSSNFDVPFYLNPLLSQYTTKSELETEISYLKTNVSPFVNPNVRLGCAQEHYYMQKTAAQSLQQFQWLLDLAKIYDMPYSPLFVSWWGGTPLWVSDGLGGQFGDAKYQQVCWSETDNYDEGSSLRTLLGSKWDIHYGWTIPNIWSSTPWLTMNSSVLNNARAAAISSKLGTLKSVLIDPNYVGCSNYLLGVTMENEPRYWDWHCPDWNYPVTRLNLWGDFNPLTVADAAQDGVTLDPSDGLSYQERMWLHTNVANYQQDTYNAHASALRGLGMPFINSSTDSFWHEIYSHAFPSTVFPMDQVTDYHPGLEWNRLNGCRAGLEDVANPVVTYLEKAREWGRWSQVNYEENNGISTDVHLRALRACYAFGARFYNFYNWQTINSNNSWINYVRSFIADTSLTTITQQLALIGAEYVDTLSCEVSKTAGVSAPLINQINFKVSPAGDYVVRVYDSPSKNRLFAYRLKTVPVAGSVYFDLPNCISLDSWPSPYVVLSRNDGQHFGVWTNPNGSVVWSEQADSARERTQSLMICWRSDAQALIADLRSKNMPGLELADQLFDAGDYRLAYEAAALVDSTYPNGVPDIIIDNNQTGYTSTGSLSLFSSSSAYGGSYRRANTGQTQTATATWCPTIQAPGYYDVSVWYPQASTRSAVAPFTIQYRGGSTTMQLNQTINGNQWVKIGSQLPFDAGTAGFVRLGNGTGENGKNVVADAVKFDYISAFDLTAPRIYSANATPAMAAEGDTITVSVDVTDNVGVSSVAMGNTQLTKGVGNIWTGSITADSDHGTHVITVVATDAFQNSSTNLQASYLTVPVVGLTNSSLNGGGAVPLAIGKYLFKTWGSVTAVDGDYLTLSDGSPTSITVYCPGHAKIVGDFVIARGSWEPLAESMILKCQPSHVLKQQ